MPDEIRIRPATEADCELLLELIVELATYEKAPEQVSGDPQTLRRTLFEDHAAEALIVERGEEVAGYAMFFTTFSSWTCRSGIWLEDVYVRPALRRGGIGRRVMEHLAALALERGHARLDWCALDWNRPALNFYDEIGARRLDDWTMLRLDEEGMEALANDTVSET